MASYKDYKSISAAKKAGSMYFMGKDGKKKLAVTKEQLDAWKKKNKGKFKGSALTAWANAKGKNIAASGPPASSLRPKARPTGGFTPADTAAETAEVKKRNAAIKLAESARKNTGPNAARKKPMAKSKVAPITFSMWQNMSRAERKSKGLPVSDIGGQLGFNRFKTGITGKEYDSKGNVINGKPGAKSAGRNNPRK
jgi:hypothetical protein